MNSTFQSVKSKQTLRQRIKITLLTQQHLSNILKNIILVLEMGTLIFLTDEQLSSFLKQSFNFDSIIFNELFIYLEITLVLTLQLSFNVSLIRTCYLRCFSQFNYKDPSSILRVTFTLFALIIDFLKTTNVLKTFRNNFSERFNSMKLLGYFINISLVIGLQYQNHIFTILLFLFCIIFYLLRIRFQLYNQDTQFYFEMICLCSVSVSTSNIIQLYSQKYYAKYSITLLFVLLCVHFTIKYFTRFKWECLNNFEEIQKQQFSNIFIEITKYLHESKFQIKQSKIIEQFLSISNDQKLPHLTMSTRQEYLKSLYKLVLNHKKQQCDNLSLCFLLVELQVEAHHNIINSLKLINQITQSRHWRSWIMKIELFRLQQYLKFQTNNISFDHKYHYVGQKTIQGFLLNCEFIKILTRATDEYFEMWKEFVNVYPIVTKLKKRLNSLLKASSKVHKTYQSLQQHKNKYSALFYYFYLNMVSKNDQRIKEIEFDVDILKSRVSEIIPYENSIFISIDLECKFIEIGQNVIGLLGFQKYNLQGKNISMIVPHFCRQQHQSWFDDYFNLIQSTRNIQSIVKVNKFTVCIDSQERLRKVQVNVNLFLMNNDFQLVGHIKVLNNVKNILTIKRNGQILATSYHPNECYTKYIHQSNEGELQEIIQALPFHSVFLELEVDETIVGEEYTLMKTIFHQNHQQIIYILQGQNETFCKMKNQITISPTFNNVIYKFSKGKSQFQFFNKLQQTKRDYKLKHSKCKTTFKSFLFIVFIIFVFSSILFLVQINFKEQKQLLYLANCLEIYQTASIYVINIVSKSYQIYIQQTQQLKFKILSQIPLDQIIYQITSSHKSFEILQTVYQPYLSEKFGPNLSFQTPALLIAESMVEIFDWMILDLVANRDSPHSMKSIQYLRDNTEMLLLNLFPQYQKTIINALLESSSHYKKYYMILITIHLLMIIFSVFFLIFFAHYFQVESNKIIETILALQNQNLRTRITQIQIYKKMLSMQNQLKDVIDNSQIQTIIQQNRSTINQFSVGPSGTVTINELINKSKYERKPIQQIPIDLDQAKKIKIRQRYYKKPRYVFIIILSLVVIGLIINCGILYFQTSRKERSLVNYIVSLKAFKTTFQKYGIMFTSLMLNLCTNNSKQDLLKGTMDNFTKSTLALQEYDTTLFGNQYFSQFVEVIQHINNNPICSYSKCVNYYTQLNMTYYANLHYSYSLIQNIYQTIKQRNTTIPQLKDNYELDYLIYVDHLYMQLLQKAFSSAFKGIYKIINKVQKQTSMLLFIQFTFSSFFVLICCYEIRRYIKRRNKMFGILDLFKQQLPQTTI